jgi:hypothetical protein
LLLRNFLSRRWCYDIFSTRKGWVNCLNNIFWYDCNAAAIINVTNFDTSNRINCYIWHSSIIHNFNLWSSWFLSNNWFFDINRNNINLSAIFDSNILCSFIINNYNRCFRSSFVSYFSSALCW